MRKPKARTAFSLLELSVVVVIISFLIAGIFSGKRMIEQGKLQGAQALTKASPVYSIPDLSLWLETSLEGSVTGATNGKDVVNNEAVSSWNDISSGGKLNISQNDSNRQPRYISNGINKLPSIKFDGINDVLYSTSPPLDKGSMNHTVITVWKSSSSLPDSILLEQGNSSANNSVLIWLNGANLKPSFSNHDVTPVITLATDVSYINAMVVDNFAVSNNISNYVYNDTSVSTLPQPSTYSTASYSSYYIGNDFLSVGARTTSGPTYSYISNVFVSEIIMFKRNLSPTEISSIINYLSKKYNIKIS